MKDAVDRINDVVHQRNRLALLTVLDEVGQSDFRFLQQQLDLTAGNLSRHLSVLSDAGFVIVDKTLEGARPRTWVRITQEGSIALAEEVAALREILNLG